MHLMEYDWRMIKNVCFKLMKISHFVKSVINFKASVTFIKKICRMTAIMKCHDFRTMKM